MDQELVLSVLQIPAAQFSVGVLLPLEHLLVRKAGAVEVVAERMDAAKTDHLGQTRPSRLHHHLQLRSAVLIHLLPYLYIRNLLLRQMN